MAAQRFPRAPSHETIGSFASRGTGGALQVAEASFDLAWPVPPLREAGEDPGARQARLALFVAVAASLLLHAIAIYSLRFRREGGFINVVPVQILEWPQRVPSAAKESSGQNAPAARVSPLRRGSSEPALNTIKPSRAALGALWTQICPQLAPAERARLHLPDCNKPPPAVWNDEEARKARLEMDAAARAQAAAARTPEIKRVPMDDAPKPGGVDLSNAAMPKARPNFGAGSKTGEEDADSRAEFKALWYLRNRPNK